MDEREKEREREREREREMCGWKIDKIGRLFGENSNKGEIDR